MLIDNETNWTSEFAAEKRSRAAATRYRDKDIRQALEAECASKCAYCESRVDHVAYEHIEHILPKERVPELVVAWENLTLACPRCNQNKGQYFDPGKPLLNPYKDEVESEVTFMLGVIVPVSAAAMRSVKVLKLDRSELVFQRHRLLASLQKLVESAKTEAVAASRQKCLGLALSHLSADIEYTSAVRAFLRHQVTGWPYEDDFALIRESGLEPSLDILGNSEATT